MTPALGTSCAGSNAQRKPCSSDWSVWDSQTGANKARVHPGYTMNARRDRHIQWAVLSPEERGNRTADQVANPSPSGSGVQRRRPADRHPDRRPKPGRAGVPSIFSA